MNGFLQHADYGVVVLNRHFQARFINRSFRDIWRLPGRKADSELSFADLILHGRETRAYAVPDSQLDRYVQRRVDAMHSGVVQKQDLRLNGGRVIRLQCGSLPGGERLLSYIDVTDLAARADRLEKKLARGAELVPAGDDSHARGAAGVPWQVRRAEAYIEANWDQRMSADDIAASAGTSQRNLFRTFQQSRGYSPMEFARLSRLRHAQVMLKLPDAMTTVSGVAVACGFENLGQFSRAYRRAFGETPSQVLSRAKDDSL